MEGGEARRNDPIGVTHVHHCFTRRNLSILSALWKKASSPILKMAILDGFTVTTIMLHFRFPAWFDKSTGPMKGWTSGTLYVPSLQGEQSWMNVLFREGSDGIQGLKKVSFAGIAGSVLFNLRVLSSFALQVVHF